MRERERECEKIKVGIGVRVRELVNKHDNRRTYTMCEGGRVKGRKKIARGRDGGSVEARAARESKCYRRDRD